ncbi:hypothetical protein TELCIR_15224 [Teladorsagia circumcincta]|uniref:G-protein coupled receptors family 1 profile domain-containing protein n=1 Tax=Teladorsagia circumcincta TaxID=45464 RepID=A0A2G9U120_TELCI|nr:hypothetical protein TELCIR_15224 [Teladorsagia circumcincta]
MTIIAQCGAYLSMFLLSLNRFVCVFKPTEYAEFFSDRSTMRYIAISTLISLAYGCVYFDESCYFIFDRDSLVFIFSNTSCGQILSGYVDFWFSIVLFAISCLLDITTLIKLQWKLRSYEGSRLLSQRSKPMLGQPTPNKSFEEFTIFPQVVKLHKKSAHEKAKNRVLRRRCAAL